MTVNPRSGHDLADRLAPVAGPAQVATADPLREAGELSIGSARAALGFTTESASRLAGRLAKSRPNSSPTEDAK